MLKNSKLKIQFFKICNIIFLRRGGNSKNKGNNAFLNSVIYLKICAIKYINNIHGCSVKQN